MRIGKTDQPFSAICTSDAETIQICRQDNFRRGRGDAELRQTLAAGANHAVGLGLDLRAHWRGCCRSDPPRW